MQTMAASVASMAAMAVLIQAMVWMGMTMPPAWQLILFFTCVGMFGCGVGMLYTPTLVDRMQLMYPSGFAVANILRALTDIRLLKRSIGQLGGGTLLGTVIPLTALKFEKIDEIGLSSSTIGAGMIVGARIGIAGAVMGFVGKVITPYLVSIGWLDANAPFRKIGFIIALGMILGATVVDMSLIAVNAVKRLKEKSKPVATTEDWKQTNTSRLVAWVAFWTVALVLVATLVLHTPLLYVLIAVGLAFFFVMGNGISTGISDSNPISSAFVITVFILAAFGLKDPGVGLVAASILLISTSTGVDMQQDRSTGWRLGTNRVIQFRYQVIGIVMGSVLAVWLAKLFMQAYPVLTQNQYANTHIPGAEKWGSAMTFKFVGALQDLSHPKDFVKTALIIGISIGLVTEVIRKILKANQGYKAFVKGGTGGFVTDFMIDSVILPSPYASSFGGFVEFPVSLWFAFGGMITSSVQTLDERRNPKPVTLAAVTAASEAETPIQPGGVAESEGGELPEDMSATSLIGGGLIAGESLAALGIGLYGLLSTVIH
jgi:uncharacterized oligopeptide transporter (OPT) family protein